MDILLENKANRAFKQKEEEFNKEKALINSAKIQLHLEQEALNKKKQEIEERELAITPMGLELVEEQNKLYAWRLGIKIPSKPKRTLGQAYSSVNMEQLEKDFAGFLERAEESTTPCKEVADAFPHVSSNLRFRILNNLKSKGIIGQLGSRRAAVYYYVRP
jgi:hypothetical protein